MEKYEFGKRVYKQVIVDGKKVGKWVVLTEVKDYDENENLIHRIDASCNYEEWNEYDEKGNCIHSSNNKGNETWWEYDSKGYQISFRNNKGGKDSSQNRYNSDDKLIFAESSNEDTYKFEYDEKGRRIYAKYFTSFGNRTEEHFYEYSDEYGDKPISDKMIVNGELKTEDFYERDDKNFWVHKKSIREGREFNFWADCEYDENGKLVKKLIYRGM
ncbi:MAG: hypothetical protein J6X67_09090 [Treponema sp.]|nr:hypothetical protein [Treponema sp.]